MAAEIVVGGRGKGWQSPECVLSREGLCWGSSGNCSALPTLTCCLPVAGVGKVPLAPFLEGKV